MKLAELFGKGKTVFSCEVFPPKRDTPVDSIYETLDGLKDIRPDFISVTYGAGGSKVNQTTREIASIIENKYHIPAMAHLTCVAAGKEDVDQLLADLKADGVENILALRGDVNPDYPPKTDFAHASDLIEEINRFGGFCVGGACYPEGHPESPNKQADLDGIRKKVDSGCAFLTTQMFFDNNILYNFLFRLLKHGINVPVVAGIMPITNVRQVKRTFALSGANLPPRFRAIVDRFGDDPAAMKQAGIAYATEQIIDLIANGVSHVHIYTMNQPDIAGRIIGNLSEIFR